jgi:hypothetical protein
LPTLRYNVEAFEPGAGVRFEFLDKSYSNGVLIVSLWRNVNVIGSFEAVEDRRGLLAIDNTKEKRIILKYILIIFGNFLKISFIPLGFNTPLLAAGFFIPIVPP